jgi:hypothetical protein
MVALDDLITPYTAFADNGYYFSEGSYELIEHLLKLIEMTDIELWLSHRLESVYVDPHQQRAFIKTNGKELSVSKIIIPIYSDIKIENHPTLPLAKQGEIKSRYQHLYLLIEDPLPPSFTYSGGIGLGISRMMNLTHLVHLTETGKQLIVLQCFGKLSDETALSFLELLKTHHFLSPSAQLLSSDSFIYEQYYANQDWIQETPNASALFEILQSSHIINLSRYLSKWKEVLKPYEEASSKKNNKDG